MINQRVMFMAVVALIGTCASGCQKAKVGVDEKQVGAFTARTFFDDGETVAVTMASDGKRSIVAVPKVAVSRHNQMGDDELSCLAKCTKIDDLESRLNCILLCPVSKSYQVFIY